MTSGNSVARPARKPGFSLVEVLTAMVVLLIGILVVARLFPGGFLSIQRTGEATMAQALASQMLEAERNAVSPPESVVALNFSDPNTWTVDTSARPDDLRDLPENDPNLPAGLDPYYLNNVNRFRRVLGETFRIPTASPNAVSGQYGAVYALRYGPVSTAGGFEKAVVVRGLSLARTVQSSAGDDPNRPGYNVGNESFSYPVLRSENEYAVDYGRRDPGTGVPLPPVVAFFPRQETQLGRLRDVRQFVVAFDYLVPDANTGVRVKRGEVTVDVRDAAPVPFGEELRPVWQPLFAGDRAETSAPPDFRLDLGLRRDSDEASRKFLNLTVVNNTTPVQEGGTASFSDDPYEFAWFSRRVGPNNSASAGFLLFNPRGAQGGLSGASAPLTARADYTIFDNHILRDDRTIPDGNTLDVKLSIPYIARYGDPGDDQRAFNGLFDSDTDRGVASTPDLLVYDLGTGELLTGIQAGNNGDVFLENGGGTAGIPFSLDAQSGSIRFQPRDDDEAKRLRGRTVRILYRGQKDWGTVLSKAHASYVQRTDLTGGLGYRDMYVAGTLPNDGADKGTRVYFPLSEAGKTVVLGEYNLADASGNVQTFSGDSFKINDNPALFSTLNGQRVTWLDVADLRKGAARFDATRTGRALAGIVGGSLRARVLWRDGSTRATDDRNVTRLRARWRRVDVESVLFDSANR